MIGIGGEFPFTGAKAGFFWSGGEKQNGLDGEKNGFGLQRAHPVTEGDGLKWGGKKRTVRRDLGLKKRDCRGLDEGRSVFSALE